MSKKKTPLQKLKDIETSNKDKKTKLIKELAVELHAKSLTKFEAATKTKKSPKYTEEQLEYQKFLSDIPTSTICVAAKEVIRKLVSKITKIEIPPLKSIGVIIPKGVFYLNGMSTNLAYYAQTVKFELKHPTVEQVEKYLENCGDDFEYISNTINSKEE